eukprot:6071471-Amphidinium_carterae.1
MNNVVITIYKGGLRGVCSTKNAFQASALTQFFPLMILPSFRVVFNITGRLWRFIQQLVHWLSLASSSSWHDFG